MTIHLKTALLAGAAWTLAASAALAQTEGQQQPVQPAQRSAAEQAQAEEAPGVEELVVTARRTEENLQEAPLSISAFSERALERLGARDTTDLQGAVPNLNIVQGRGSSNATNIYIRGVGQPDALQTFDPAVGVYVDDVYFSRIRGTQFDLLDLDRVEVLRGPQGTLYGKNTIGGALKLVTRKPGQDFQASGALTYGTYDQLEAKASVSGPVSDTLALGLAALYSKRDGYVHDPLKPGVEYNDKDTKAVRGALAWTPTDRVRLDVSADYSQDDAALQMGQATADLRSAFGPAPLPALLSIPTPPPYDFLASATPGLPNSTKLRHWGVSAILTAELSDSLTLKSITAYRDLKTDDFIDIDATVLEIGDVFVGVDQDQFSQELQLTYDSGPVTAVGGLFYLKENVGSHQEAYADDYIRLYVAPNYLPTLGFLRTIDDALETTSYAAYANVSYALTDALRISGGVRYTRDEKDYDRTTSTFSTLPALVGTFAFSASKSWDDWTPLLSVDYQVTDDILVYGRASKGFKSGGFNGRANTAGEEQPYEPETVSSLELGAKTEWADRRLRVNGAVFYNDYEDFQARVSRSVTSPAQPIPAIDFAVLNAGKLEIAGAELELTLAPARGLVLEAQVGLLDADYKEFREQRLVGGVLTTVDRSFQDPAFSPRITGRYAASYSFDLMGLGQLTVGGQARFRGETALAVDNSDIFTRARYPGLFQDDFWLYDARVAFETNDRRYGAALNWRNITDEVYRTDGQEFSSVGGIRTVYYGAPETVSLTLTAKY